MMFISVIAFFAAIVFGVMTIISLVKKNGKGKRNGWTALISFVIFIAAAVSMPVEEEANTKPVKEKQEKKIELLVEENLTISTLDKEVEVRGKVKNADEVKIDNESVAVKDGVFSKVIPLSKDKSSVEIAATRGDEETITVVSLEKEAPVAKLKITSKDTVKAKQYNLTGETEKAAKVQLFQEGKEVASTTAGEDGKFAFNKLGTEKSGEYEYEIKVSKEGYESTDQKHSVLRTMSKEEEVQDLKNSAITIDYKQLEKNKNRDVGKVAKFKGQIVQILEDGDYTVIRLSIAQASWGWDTNAILWVEYAGTTKFVQDDIITVYGRMMGEHSYESQAGWEVSVPSMLAEIIE